ncbi:hypothetical protein ACPCHQ_17000 [Ralstonia thomasii]|jgi:type 1 fimbria pilin|uniref:Bacteriophage protein n=2 Tax=Ralstonia TaxID=48736 RepID=A0ABN9JEV8_9RALS|nr:MULTISPECIES: hypothetical protein [Ralstonia]MBT2177783.1 hypothetical protein [Ralstonia pickettii]CAJ0710682.1 hypothetical protein LMG7143_01684 [Ralstonia sp. LMG 18095]CAJ0806321.1 hypothetical protein LMG18095_04421 [Ralstonia sp. LMG 18095]
MGIYDGNSNMPKAAFPLTGNEQLPASTGLANGLKPQDETISPIQLSVFGTPAVALTDGANIAIDASQSKLYTVTLAGNRTLSNPTNLQAGQRWDIIVTQDGTGNRTLAYGAAYKKVGGAVTLSTAAGAIDILHCWTDGTTVYVTIDKAFT